MIPDQWQPQVQVNPVAAENAIRDTSDEIAKSVLVCDRTYRAFLDADREYDAAFAHAYLAHVGPQTEKRYAAELATQKQREARDVADAAYRYADRQSRALQDKLRAWQSVNASVRAMFGAAGAGER